MTKYELEKLAKGVAKYIVEEIKSDNELFDTIFPPKTMGIEEASKYLCIPKGTIYQKKKEIPHIKVGKRLVFTDRGLMRWLQRETGGQ